MPGVQASDGNPIRQGHVYVCAPNRHMIVADGKLRLTHGPRENNSRPAIDPLFRTAAKIYRNRMIAIVLSGNLDDGTEGAMIVNRYGGGVIAPQPQEALYPRMPHSGIE